MMTKKDGGPAFPSRLPGSTFASGGMSLRDYFAGEALMGAVAREGILAVSHDREREKTAAQAYALADAMIAERKRD